MGGFMGGGNVPFGWRSARRKFRDPQIPSAGLLWLFALEHGVPLLIPMNNRAIAALCVGLTASLSAASEEAAVQPGYLERIDPAIDLLISPDARIEVIGSGFAWSEGPVWRKQGGYLLFSDIPNNTIY